MEGSLLSKIFRIIFSLRRTYISLKFFKLPTASGIGPVKLFREINLEREK